MGVLPESTRRFDLASAFDKWSNTLCRLPNSTILRRLPILVWGRMTKQAILPERGAALRELLRRQIRAVVLLVVRIAACALLLTLLKPLWGARPWLSNLLFGLGGLLCGIPLLRDVGRNWRWRIALGQAYLAAGHYEDAEVTLKPLDGIQGQLFDPEGGGLRALETVRRKKKEVWEQ